MQHTDKACSWSSVCVCGCIPCSSAVLGVMLILDTLPPTFFIVCTGLEFELELAFVLAFVLVLALVLALVSSLERSEDVFQLITEPSLEPETVHSGQEE